jgi:hypothetical protein
MRFTVEAGLEAFNYSTVLCSSCVFVWQCFEADEELSLEAAFDEIFSGGWAGG